MAFGAELMRELEAAAQNANMRAGWLAGIGSNGRGELAPQAPEARSSECRLGGGQGGERGRGADRPQGDGAFLAPLVARRKRARGREVPLRASVRAELKAHFLPCVALFS